MAISTKGAFHAEHCSGDTDSALGGGAADLALQQRLGVLSFRRAWASALDRARDRAERKTRRVKKLVEVSPLLEDSIWLFDQVAAGVYTYD